MKDNRESDSFLTLRRYRHWYNRKKRDELLKSRRGKPNRRGSKYNSLYLDAISMSMPITLSRSLKTGHVDIPSTFSFLDAPVEALNTIAYLAAYGRCGTKIRKLYFDHSRLRKTDLAAESVLDLIAMEFRRERGPSRKKLKISGAYPKNIGLIRFIKAIGIIKSLDVRHEMLPDEVGLQIFKKHNNKFAQQKNVRVADHKEKVVRKFVDHIDSCLKERISKNLNPKARMNLASYTGEIIGNAEDHSGLNDWTIAGYLDEESGNQFCEITIFNFGETIADTFKPLNESNYAYRLVKPYLDAHTEKSLFSRTWDVSCLLTLISLQGGVSSKSSETAPDRGQGTVEMVKFFQQLHTEISGENGRLKAEMALLSGDTFIKFDGKYEMVEVNGFMTIAFNEENSLRKKPDTKYVRKLDNVHFPGTLISIRFPLEASQVQAVS